MLLSHGNKSIVDKLIRAGADLNQGDNTDRTALMYAAIHGNKSIVDALLAAGADVCIQNNEKKFAADLASASLPRYNKKSARMFSL